MRVSHGQFFEPFEDAAGGYIGGPFADSNRVVGVANFGIVPLKLDTCNIDVVFEYLYG